MMNEVYSPVYMPPHATGYRLQTGEPAENK